MTNQHTYDKLKNLDHRALHNALETACINGSLNEVHYLLTSSELKFEIDIHIYNNPLFLACQSGNLHIVKYLLTSPELSKHGNIYSHKSRCFKAVCNSQHLDIAEYLVCEYRIEKNDHIENYLRSKKTPFALHVKHLFEMQNLKSSLENELNSDKLSGLTIHKIKI